MSALSLAARNVLNGMKRLNESERWLVLRKLRNDGFMDRFIRKCRRRGEYQKDRNKYIIELYKELRGEKNIYEKISERIPVNHFGKVSPEAVKQVIYRWRKRTAQRP